MGVGWLAMFYGYGTWKTSAYHKPDTPRKINGWNLKLNQTSILGVQNVTLPETNSKST